jgi:hypothetical protein
MNCGRWYWTLRPAPNLINVTRGRAARHSPFENKAVGAADPRLKARELIPTLDVAARVMYASLQCKDKKYAGCEGLRR